MSYLKTYMDYKISALTLINWYVDFHCMGQEFAMNQVSLFYMTLKAYALLPLILLGINFLLWAIYMQIVSLCYPDIGGARLLCKRLTNRVALTFGICMFPIYTQICGLLLQSTSCFKSLAKDSLNDEGD